VSICPHCATDFPPRRSDQVYCTPKCRIDHYHATKGDGALRGVGVGRAMKRGRKPARLGRPPRADRAQVRVRINVTLPRDVADYLTELGDGNRSQAIVELARGTTLPRSTLRGMCPPAST